jgi:hypothetical protein
MLLTIRSIEVHHPDLRGSGIRRAAFLIGRARPEMGLVTNEKYARNVAWRRYKGISHLSAALLLLEAAGVKFDEPTAIPVFFAIASDYETFGISFRAHSREEYLLDRDELWSVPKRLAMFKLENPKIPFLHKDDLAVLREYRPWDAGKR